jgi:hypothetical protein
MSGVMNEYNRMSNMENDDKSIAHFSIQLDGIK